MNKGKEKGRSLAAPACNYSTEALLILLSRPLDVLDHRAKLFPELLVAVIDTVHVGASARHALDDPAGLLDMLIAHPVQRKLRRVEGHSVSAMDGRSRPERDQGFIARR